MPYKPAGNLKGCYSCLGPFFVGSPVTGYFPLRLLINVQILLVGPYYTYERGRACVTCHNTDRQGSMRRQFHGIAASSVIKVCQTGKIHKHQNGATGAPTRNPESLLKRSSCLLAGTGSGALRSGRHPGSPGDYLQVLIFLGID